MKKLILSVVMALIAMTGFGQTWNIGYPNEKDVVATLTNGTLVIRGTGDTQDYYETAPPWNDISEQIFNVTIEDGITSIGGSLFERCASIKSITIPNSVQSIGDDAMSDCSSLTSIILPDGLLSIGYFTFSGSGLVSIVIPNSVTDIGGYAFCECKNLTSATLGNGITNMGWSVFSNSGLTSIVIPNKITTISNYAFQNCYNLTSVTIGSGVTSIGFCAFDACFDLSSIIVLNANPSVITLDDFVFRQVNTNNCTLTVPNAVVELYRNAPTWQNFYMITGGAEANDNLPYLTNLSVNAGIFLPVFSPYIHTYQMTVPQSIDNIVLTATAMNDEATVSGDGKKTLNTGENTFEITVNSPLGSSVYTLIITRLSVENLLRFISYKEVTTGAIQATFYDYVTGSDKTFSVIDQYQLEYELITDNFSGNLPLHFDIGNGQETYNQTVNVNALSIYKITLYLNLLPPQLGDISYTTYFDNYGRPSYTTIDYKYQLCDVVVSDDNEELTTTEINRVVYKTSRTNDIRSISVTSSLIGNFTSIKELPAVQNINVFPNPAVDFVTVSGLQGNETLYIYNINGQLLITRKAAGETETVPVGHLPSGVYLLKTSSGQTVKWVKQ